ncbi:AMP-dependent synthetase/ligase [Beggiatoa leptomitoformis]|uniref:AMP-binding protein n=1 Tax=Beggiatoa leptomitoformis TaxID=288004 RepID=A0A650GCT8_9GAMM|nr:AMP-binding protein [Beggiatoa leptomitoformis]ALG68382.1 AMP-binding protein [Beggiatoa leptomitoformis]QGX04104.1 AMP-binding protein [Beggiatoa leptomitoformis]
MSELDTFPKLLVNHAKQRPHKVAIREKDFGIWQSWTWSQVYEQVRELVCGLSAMGLQQGDKVAIIGDNRPRLYWAMIATQTLGAIPVPLYQDAAAEEMQYVLEHAEARFAFAEDQEQVDKLLDIKDRCPHLEQIIYDEPRGMRFHEMYEKAFLHSYTHIQERGKHYQFDNTGLFSTAVEETQASNTAIIVYTSGTTGRPKGVMLSHDNLIITARNAIERDGLSDKEEVLAYLPMAWVGDNLFSYAQYYTAGFCVNCPESSDTVLTDLRELGPTYFFAPPRIYESLLTQVMIRMEDASYLKRQLFHYFMAFAKQVGINVLDGQEISLADQLRYKLGNFLLYEPLKNVLGLSRIRLAYTAGEAIGPEIFQFYRSLGINVKQLYGMTEGSVFVCTQLNGQVKPDTVGVPSPQVEMKISDTGEVVFRSPGVFQGYFKNPQATAETKDAEGWFHTGDAGFFDESGQLKIIDRAKDVGKLTDGAMFAPKYIENKLKFFPHIKEAVAFGDERDYATAFINIDLGSVGNWAERRNLAYTGYNDLAGQSAVYDLIEKCIEQVNFDLSKEPHLAGSQIKRFLILHKELDADDGELTRTGKVRRRPLAEKYATLINALYSEQDTINVEAAVKFEDGREGMIRATVKIRHTKTFTPVAKAS